MAAESGYFLRKASGLIREFGLADYVLMSTTLIWALIYSVVQYAWFYGFNPGADLPLALLICTLPFSFQLLVYWAIGVIMPRSGSDYVWVSRIIHPGVGFAWSFVYMMVVFSVTFPYQALAYSYLMSSGLVIWGILYKAPAVTDMGTFLSSPVGSYLFVIGLSVIFAFLAILGAKAVKALVYAGWAFTLVGYGLMWWLLGMTNPTVFAAKWNGVMTGYPTYQALQDSAVNAGWTPPTVGIAATLASLPLAVLFLLGGNYGNVILGEVKSVRRTVPIGLFLSMFLAVFFWGFGGYLTLNAFGANWLYALAYSWEVQPSSYTLPFPPSQPLFLSIIAYPNAPLIALNFLTWIFGSSMALFLYFWIPSRYFFAWSFDRVIPTRFADVGRRFKSPHIAIVAILALNIVMEGLYVFTGYAAAFTVATFMWIIVYSVPALAAVILPYRRKDLLEQAPGFMRKRIAGVSVMTLLGLAFLVSFVYLGYVAYVNPLITGLTVSGFMIVVVLAVTGAAIYLVSYLYHKRRGLDITMALKELPPV